MDDTITSRLDKLFGGLKPTLPEDEERLSPAERLLARDPDLWAAVQERRQEAAAAEAAKREAEEVMALLEEAAQASGLPYEFVRERLETASPTQRALQKQLDGILDPDERLAGDPQAEHLARVQRDAEFWNETTAKAVERAVELQQKGDIPE